MGNRKYDLTPQEKQELRLEREIKDYKGMCLVMVEKMFDLKYKNKGDEILHDLVDRMSLCEDGGNKIVEITIEICENYLRERMVPPTTTGKLVCVTNKTLH